VRRGRRGRLGRFALSGAVVLTLAGTGAYAYAHGFRTSLADALALPQCTVATSTGTVRLSPEQTGNAATIIAAAGRQGLPERAAVIAVATAIQESSLRNLDHGDRDSLGLFQQRPSQGWGSPAQLQDPVYSTGRFYDALIRVPSYDTLPLTVAAQKVQRSATPEAYGAHEVDATVLTEALTGADPAALTCRVRSGVAAGSTPSSAALREELRTTFGSVAFGGSPDGAGEAGRGTDVLLGAGSDVRRGWAVAHWAVARASALGVTEVRHDGMVWSAARSGDGWRPAQAGADRVHLTVAATG
jgi:hypothetical protein